MNEQPRREEEFHAPGRPHIVLLIILIIAVAGILLIPQTTFVNDGGTVELSAPLWGVTKYQVLVTDDDQVGYNLGTRVRILWFDVYNDYPREYIPLKSAE